MKDRVSKEQTLDSCNCQPKKELECYVSSSLRQNLHQLAFPAIFLLIISIVNSQAFWIWELACLCTSKFPPVSDPPTQSPGPQTRTRGGRGGAMLDWQHIGQVRTVLVAPIREPPSTRQRVPDTRKVCTDREIGESLYRPRNRSKVCTDRIGNFIKLDV